jgi:thiol-disulfide isomerase/thioredoxin
MIRETFQALATLVLVTAALVRPAAAARPNAPSKGDVVPAFETTGIDGKPREIDFPRGSKTVLLFFLSGCPSCHKMIPEWNRAYGRRPKGLRVWGVIMDQEPPGFWSMMSIAFPVVRSPGRQFLRNLNVNRVPLMLRVGEGGTIEDLSLGVTDPIRLGELFKP